MVLGVSPSPFLLNATIQHHIEKYQISHPDLVKVLMQSIYVDDVVFGADTEDAHALYASSREILSHGSFNLRKFATNSPRCRTRSMPRKQPQLRQGVPMLLVTPLKSRCQKKPTSNQLSLSITVALLTKSARSSWEHPM